MVRDPATGKYRRTRLFVFTLGCSRKAVRVLVCGWTLSDLGSFRRHFPSARSITDFTASRELSILSPELQPSVRWVPAMKLSSS
jgi:hypothetical protein